MKAGSEGKNKTTDGDKEKFRLRCGVERVFGVLKLHHRMAQARYWGKVRNQMRFMMIGLAYNLKRGMNLQREINHLQASCP